MSHSSERKRTPPERPADGAAERPAGAKTVAESRVRLSQFMSITDANLGGNVHGGSIMKLVDEAGALAAIRHARSLVVTVVMDSMTFMEPIYVGNVVTMEAVLTYAGRTSMEARVEVVAEDALTGKRTHTNTAYLVYVAIDSEGNPQPVPPLIAETDEEREQMEAARERQEYRKKQRLREEKARQRLNAAQQKKE